MNTRERVVPPPAPGASADAAAAPLVPAEMRARFRVAKAERLAQIPAPTSKTIGVRSTSNAGCGSVTTTW